MSGPMVQVALNQKEAISEPLQWSEKGTFLEGTFTDGSHQPSGSWEPVLRCPLLCVPQPAHETWVNGILEELCQFLNLLWVQPWNNPGIPTKTSTRWVGLSIWSDKSNDRCQPRPAAQLPKTSRVSEFSRGQGSPQPDPQGHHSHRKLCPAATHHHKGRVPVSIYLTTVCV